MKTTMQCDRCGGEMILSEDGLQAKCPYCNHKILFRSPKGEALLLSLARANALRRDSRFSDAIREYRIITEENPEDAEAFWGLVLSTYGIEYVKDGRTGRYIPTCHRTVRQSILENEDYLRAIGTATEDQRADYTAQANEIDRLQKDILRRTESAEDFDVFISFKSTDDHGNPTKDAQIARTIYDELTKRGFKTFFSDVTLNNVLFSDYEPVIFRALYSCKFFILVATRPEYITAAWVKNEWSRFEQRMEEEKLSGVACAVFDGKEVRELPPFLRAQGIDLGRHAAGGYEVLLADAIERKLGKSEKSKSDEEIRHQIEEQKRQQAEIEERLTSIGGGSVKNLLIRAEQMLKMDREDEARDYYTRALDARPDCAEAWWGLFLMDMEVKKETEIFDKLDIPMLEEIHSSDNLKLAEQYAEGAMKEKLQTFSKELYTRTKEVLYPSERKAYDERQKRFDTESEQYDEEEQKLQAVKEALKKERDKLSSDEAILRNSKENKWCDKREPMELFLWGNLDPPLSSKYSEYSEYLFLGLNLVLFVILLVPRIITFPFLLARRTKIRKCKDYVIDMERKFQARRGDIVRREKEFEAKEDDFYEKKYCWMKGELKQEIEESHRLLSCLYFATDLNGKYHFEDRNEADYAAIEIWEEYHTKTEKLLEKWISDEEEE